MDIWCTTNLSYHPQCNSQANICNKTIAKYLAAFVDDSILDWEIYVPALLFAYNTNFHRSVQATPSSLPYGLEAWLPSFFASDFHPMKRKMRKERKESLEDTSVQEELKVASQKVIWLTWYILGLRNRLPITRPSSTWLMNICKRWTELYKLCRDLQQMYSSEAEMRSDNSHTSSETSLSEQSKTYDLRLWRPFSDSIVSSYSSPQPEVRSSQVSSLPWPSSSHPLGEPQASSPIQLTPAGPPVTPLRGRGS